MSYCHILFFTGNAYTNDTLHPNLECSIQPQVCLSYFKASIEGNHIK